MVDCDYPEGTTEEIYKHEEVMAVRLKKLLIVNWKCELQEEKERTKQNRLPKTLRLKNQLNVTWKYKSASGKVEKYNMQLENTKLPQRYRNTTRKCNKTTKMQLKK